MLCVNALCAKLASQFYEHKKCSLYSACIFGNCLSGTIGSKTGVKGLLKFIKIQNSSDFHC